MKALRIIVFGSFGFVILLMVGGIIRGDISGNDAYYDTSFETAYENYEYELEYLPEEIPYEDVVESEAAPMPEELFSSSDLIGKWVNEDDPDQVKVVHFFVENNCLMYRYYYIVPGNSIGMNIANEVTEWDCYDGMVSIMSNQGNVYCHRGMDQEISISFYYGFDGPNVMYDQEYGRAFYRAE